MRTHYSKSTLAVKPTSTVVAKTVEVKPVKIEFDASSQVTAEVCTVWVKKGTITLYDEHKQMILNDNSKLNDLIINAAQTILKKQFAELMELQWTLLLKKPQPRFQAHKPYVQIIFDRKDHRIVPSTLFSRSGQVKVYDSVSTTIDRDKSSFFQSLWTRSFTSFG